jgi:hypothetical protein
MMRPLRWKLSKGYDAAGKISTRIACRAGNAGMCVNEDTINESCMMHEMFATAVTNGGKTSRGQAFLEF